MAVAGATMNRSYRKYRAPRANGAALVEPPLGDVAEMLADNRRKAQIDFGPKIAGAFDLSRSQLAHQARREIVRLATAYTGSYRHVADSYETDSMIMSGHQPSLFHPGVWFKNFALSQLATTHAATAIHLIVDNDIVAAPAIETPAKADETVVRQRVMLDDAQSARPYEEWQIINRACFDKVADSLAAQLKPFVEEPLITQLWPAAQAAADRHGNLGLALSQARHSLEEEIGLQTLELPVSRMADTASFRQFCAAILLNAVNFRSIYNQEVVTFRTAHRIRSQAHPVPQLQATEDWIEVPFWTWTSAAPTRLPLYVRRVGNELELRPGRDGTIRRGPANPGATATWLADLRGAGLKIRPRALSMTMFARLLLSDLFLHGIGGAKYDELGDAIAAAFFGIEPAGFMTMSATVLLPLGSRQIDQDDVRQMDGCIRDLWFHPEDHVDVRSDQCPTDIRNLAEKKNALKVSPPPRGNRKVWHDEIAQINDSLRAHLLEQRETLLRERSLLVSQLRSEDVLRSREFSFSLFAKPRLKAVLLDLSSPSR
jgi:hypothetical protein